MDSDPTADLTDADVRRVCDEADESIHHAPTGRCDDQDREHVRRALTGGRMHATWAPFVRGYVARLRAERAKKGTK